MTEAEQIMKRCQVGTRNYDEANNLHAACYGLIGKLSAQRQWVGLTEDERDHLTGLHLYAVRGQVEAWIEGVDDFAQAYEAKLKEKNT